MASQIQSKPLMPSYPTSTCDSVVHGKKTKPKPPHEVAEGLLPARLIDQPPHQSSCPWSDQSHHGDNAAHAPLLFVYALRSRR